MGGGFKNKNVTLSPRLKTITRTKIITFKTNHQSASPEFRGLGFPDQYHACGSRQILKEKARRTLRVLVSFSSVLTLRLAFFLKFFQGNGL